MLPIRGAATKWLTGATVSALLFVPSHPALSAPSDATARPRYEHVTPWQARTAEASRSVVLTAAMVDRFQPTVAAPATLPAPRATSASSRTGRAITDRTVRVPHVSAASLRAAARTQAQAPAPHIIDLVAASQVPALAGGFTTTSSASPIPEPTSNFLFLAGVGLIALVARRKFTAPRRM